MKNNNGKIAIAIVAMFVVALSVVGFTYAYFTSQVVDNKKTESVKVTAGELEINYTLNQTIEAQNVVPGWISDNDKYYDPVRSVTKVGNENQIVAVSYATYKGEGIPLGEGEDAVPAFPDTVATLSEAQAELLQAYGLTKPAMFTVQNTGTDTAYYAIELKDVQNGIVASNAADADYVRVQLYSSSTDKAYDADWGTAIYDEKLTTEATQVIVAQASIDADENADADENPTQVGKTVYYKLVLRYDNNTQAVQNVPAPYSSKTLSASVYVRGLGQNGDATTAPAGE